MTKNIFHIALKGPGIIVERKISEDLAQQVALLILTGGKNQILHDESISLNDFLQQCNARRNPERFVAIAYFLKKYRNRLSFDKNDMVDGFEEACQQFPANFSRDFKAVKSTDWIAPKSGRPGTFYLTESGISAVDTKFSSEGSQKHQSKNVPTEIETLIAEYKSQ